MNMETYEETRIPRDESWAKYLKEGATVALLVWNNKVLAINNLRELTAPDPDGTSVNKLLCLLP